MRIAHLSDLHLFTGQALLPQDLMSRRVFGAVNLVLSRRRTHSADVAAAAVEAVGRAGVDHCVVSGDLTNLALEGEFALAARVLRPLGSWDRLTVVPGNHDFYTPGALRTRRFERWFGHTLWHEDDPASWTYPVVKDIGEVRLIALRSAMVAPPLTAFGRVGEAQATALWRALDEAVRDGRFTVVVLHHNLHKRDLVHELTGILLDRRRISEMLGRGKAGLVLHGHDHTEHEMTLGNGGQAATRVMGCGSTSARLPGTPVTGRFNIYTIGAGGLTVERWRYQKALNRFVPGEGSEPTSR
jgi:3',5'-cyclic AMP phosphodiesterase CpdA